MSAARDIRFFARLFPTLAPSPLVTAESIGRARSTGADIDFVIRELLPADAQLRFVRQVAAGGLKLDSGPADELLAKLMAEVAAGADASGGAAVKS